MNQFVLSILLLVFNAKPVYNEGEITIINLGETPCETSPDLINKCNTKFDAGLNLLENFFRANATDVTAMPPLSNCAFTYTSPINMYRTADYCRQNVSDLVNPLSNTYKATVNYNCSELTLTCTFDLFQLLTPSYLSSIIQLINSLVNKPDCAVSTKDFYLANITQGITQCLTIPIFEKGTIKWHYPNSTFIDTLQYTDDSNAQLTNHSSNNLNSVTPIKIDCIGSPNFVPVCNCLTKTPLLISLRKFLNSHFFTCEYSKTFPYANQWACI